MSATRTSTGFILMFRSLYLDGRGYAFPCDAKGRVDMGAMSDRLRDSYLYARSVVGWELATPAVCEDRYR
jgi:hypothetical protein